MEQPCDKIPEPDTLQTALDFLSVLNSDSSAKTKIITTLRNAVPDCLKSNEDMRASYGRVAQVSELSLVLASAAELRKRLILTGFPNSYSPNGRFPNLKITDQECIQKLTKYLTNLLPKLYVTLLYLYYNVTSSFSSCGGGTWMYYNCDGSNNNGYTKGLSKWLREYNQGLSSGYSLVSYSSSSAKLLAGGYISGKITPNKGNSLTQSLYQLVNPSSGGGWMPKILLDLLFVTQWSPCNTATALVFTGAFCKEAWAPSGMFSRTLAKYQSVRISCQAILTNLEPFNCGISGSTPLLIALFDGSVYHCKSIMNPQICSLYLLWYKHNLDILIKSLSSMSEDCATWDKDSLQRGLYAGPFAYGFTFGARWNNKDNWSDLHTELQQKVNALTSSLRKLKSDLDSIPVPSSWPTSYQDPTTNSHPNPNPNPESPAHQTADSSLSVGSAASAATLLGAGGAVVYYLDIGGFGTLVKSFF